MPQETILNVAPYFDDFDKDDDFYRVLFKPGYPVQARELTTLQSILQNQIEQFANHFFKEGTAVNGGQVNYIRNYPCVMVEDSFNGRSLIEYAAELLGRVIIGSQSGVRARIESYLPRSSSERGLETFYVVYLGSNTSSSRFSGFIPGENLLLEQALQTTSSLDRELDDDNDKGLVETLENLLSFQALSPFAKCIANNPNSVGSAVTIEDGVYYIRGHFVQTPAKTLLLDQYSNNPSYKIGFFIDESIDTYLQNDDLLDNAQGFPNFAAPGADRLVIEPELVKIDINDLQDLTNFVQILEVRSGILQNQNRTTEYTKLAEEFARRTFEQSGNFYVRNPSVSVRNSLNNRKGNDGLFLDNETTLLGQKPSESLGAYKISPLKAYIQGYEVETIAPSILDFEKPRTTKTLQQQSVTYFTGPTFVLNRVYGYPTLGIGTNFYLSLRDQRVGSAQNVAPGKEIGVARVYDYELESGDYNLSNKNLNEWDISLYDIQPYTEITLNEPISLQTPTSIKGKSSGATAHLRYSASNSGIITAYNIRGRFSIGEKLFFNGIENPRIIKLLKENSISDVKSLFGTNSNGTYFSADTKLYNSFNVGQVNISPVDSGISTVTSTNVNLDKIFNIGDICAYTNPTSSTIVYNRVTAVSVQAINVQSVQSVSGINDGSLPTIDINPSDFRKVSPSFQKSIDNTLYTQLPKKYVSSVNLEDSILIVRKTYPVSITGGETNTISAGTNLNFLPFEPGRYVLTRDDGTIENLSSDKFGFGNNFKELTIIGLGTNTTGNLVATLEKRNLKSKIKVRNKVKSIVVDKSRNVGSGIGTTTLNDGLTYGNYPYGTRVQDEEISLNYADVTKILGIYESNDTLEPDLRKITLLNFNGPNATTFDVLIGEEFVGNSSGAVAIVVEKPDALTIGFIYLNTATFQIGETVSFKQSNVSADITALTGSDLDVTSKYTLDSGYRNTLYDYSRIVRKPEAREPSKKLKIVFEYASYNNSDDGDITTVNSYSNYDYCDIPSIDGIRNSDILDIRPIVDPYSVSEGSYSPFEFFGRSFDASNNSSDHILASDELITLNYSYYLPRIDRIFLDKTGQFHLVKGEPAENPTVPAGKDGSIEIATISLPAYLCDISLANVKLAEHKRYQMQDIKRLEDRIKNLEYYTSLSLLESDTSNLFISDSNGLNRFKSGFFVDNFESAATQLKITGVKNSIDVKKGELRPSHFTTEIDLLLGTFTSLGIGTDITSDLNLDFKFDGGIIGENIRRTGNIITLDYEEIVEISQFYATEVTAVAAYSDAFYAGDIELIPSSDVWVDQVKLEPNIVDVQGKYTKTSTQLTQEQFNQQTGFGPVLWNSWETAWTGQTQIPKGTRDTLNGYDIVRETLAATKKTGTSSRQGIAEKEIEAFNNVSFGESIVSTDFIKTMRSRNIEFTAKKLKPLTRVYSFFDKAPVTQYCIPKLLEIQMISGTFTVGETVKTLVYKIPSSGNGAVTGGVVNPYVQFRVASPNHKYGPFNNPVDFYTTNPYKSNERLPTSYSPTSSILNIDTYSLSNQPQGDYYGYVTVGMELVGTTSGAKARVSNIRLITDVVGTVIGSFYIPNANVPSNPKFETGTKIFRLTSEENNVTINGIQSTGAEEKFYAEGSVRVSQQNILSVRNVQTVTATLTETKPAVEIGEPFVVSTAIVGNIKPPPPPPEQPEPEPQPQIPTDPGPPPVIYYTYITPNPSDPDFPTTDPQPPGPGTTTDPTDPTDPTGPGGGIDNGDGTITIPNPEGEGEITVPIKTAKVAYVFNRRGRALPVWSVPFTYRRGRNKGQTAILNFNRIKKENGKKAAKKAFKAAGYPLPPRNYPGRGKPVRPTGGDKKTTKIAVKQGTDGTYKIVDTSKKAREAKKNKGKSNVLDVIKPGDPDFNFYNKGDAQLWKHGATLAVTQHPKAVGRVTRRGNRKFEEKGYPVGKLPLTSGPVNRVFPPAPPPRRDNRGGSGSSSSRTNPAPNPRPVPLRNQNRVIGAGYPPRPSPAPAPRPAPRPPSPPSPRPSPRPPSPSPSPSGGGGSGNRGGGGGGRGGRRSDINLKTNIVIISNALNRLLNI